MTTTTTTPGDGGAAAAEDGPRRPRRRWLTAVVVVLLVVLPLGYLVGSAKASRDSGENKQRLAAAEGLIHDWPSEVLRRVYRVPVPEDARDVAYHEFNAWERSELLVQFTTTPDDLDAFLREIDTDRSQLRPGVVTIGRQRAAEVGWRFDTSERAYAGTVRRTPGSTPDLAVTVDLSDRDTPRVYVASTVEF